MIRRPEAAFADALIGIVCALDFYRCYGKTRLNTEGAPSTALTFQAMANRHHRRPFWQTAVKLPHRQLASRIGIFPVLIARH